MPPAVRQHIREIYALGQELGRNQHAFSKVGDSVALTPHYLTFFDKDRYTLGEYEYLQPAIDNYAGSFERYGVATSGARAVVVGRSTLVGLPQVLLLGRKGVDATVTLAHSRTADLEAVCREADIIVAAAGMAGLISADHVKPGAAVLDVGISRTEAGIVGDVDFDAVEKVAGAITPMPGGTGPMTIGCLMQNTLAAARMQGTI